MNLFSERRCLIILESILVVDDDAAVRELLSLILRDEGYLVETVEKGKQAIKTSELFLFDLALIDIKLPDMEGTELLSKLKEKWPEMIQIIITGFPSLENAMKAINEGANGYILKPFNVPKLLKTIRKHLDQKANKQVQTYIEETERRQRYAEFRKQFKKGSDNLFMR